MRPKDQEFTEVRHRRSSGGKRATHKQQQKRNNSDQGETRPFHRSTHSFAAASSPHERDRKSSGTQRRSAGQRNGDGSTDPLTIYDEPAVDLSEEGLTTGLVLEMLILEAMVNHPTKSLFTVHGDLQQLKFTDPEGDLLTWLNVTRQWVSHLQQGSAESWFLLNGVEQSSLKMVEKHVEARRKSLSKMVGQLISLSFAKDTQVSNEIISNALLNKFFDNICVYQGHPSIGYKVLASGETVFVHSSSCVHFLTNLPTFITFADVPDFTTKEVRAVMILSDATVMSLLDFNSGHIGIKKSIRDNVVKPCVFRNVGEDIAAELEKSWNDNVKEDSLKETLRFQCNDTPLLFEKDTELKTVTIYALPDYHESIRRMVHDEVKKLKTKFALECFEIGFPDDESSFRLLMGPGAANERFLFEYDFRSVWIHETTKDSLTKNFVRAEMEKYGTVVDVQVCDTGTKEESGIWGTVTFRDPDDVVKLLASTKAHDASMLIELAPNNCNSLQLDRPKVRVDRSVRVQLKLCRRPARSRTAFLTIKGARDFGILLNTKTMTIGEDKVAISACKGKVGVIQLSGINQIVEDEDIMEAVSEKFGIVPSNLHIDRPEPFSTTADDLQKFKTSLRRLVDKAADSSKVNVRVFMPCADDLHLKADLRFPTRRMAISAMDFIVGASVRGLPLQVACNPLSDPSAPNVVFKIDNDVFKTVESEINKQVARLPRQVEVLTKSTEDNHELKIFSCNVVDAEAVAARLEEILSPLEVKLTRRKMDFLVKDGKTALDASMTETGTLVNLVRDFRILRIYGTKSNAFKAKDALFQSIDALMQGAAAKAENKNYKIPLCGEDKPATLMVEVAKDLDGLSGRTGVTDLKLDVQGRTLSYTATDETHFAMQATIDSLCDLVACSCLILPKEPAQGAPNVELLECSACYCPIEGCHFSMQACEHHYCEDCIDTHLKVSLESKKFPITCVDESCGQPISVRDITVLSRKLDRSMWKVLKTSMDHYVQTRPKEYGYCHRPDCHGVIFKRPNVAAYSCPLCHAKICPRCMNQYHGSESCEDFQNITAFRQWMAASRDRKKCPNCEMGIEKVDGCNRIQCTNCKRHICWVCLEHFAEMRLAYDHLNREHNGYYG